MSNKPTEADWVTHAQEFAKFYEPTVQAKINGWSALNTGDGIAVKHLGGSTLEVCLSVGLGSVLMPAKPVSPHMVLHVRRSGK